MVKRVNWKVSTDMMQLSFDLFLIKYLQKCCDNMQTVVVVVVVIVIHLA